jgi:membrane protease subunit (stomatin/prohibitin family)
MKENIVITMDATSEHLVQFSKKYKLDKNISLTVPRGYTAIAYINGRAMYKSCQCVEEKVISKCGKEYLGKEIQFAFYSQTAHLTFSYGFGPINVNNDRLKEAYRIGVNGKMMITINDYIDLINYFSFSDNITVDDVREKILPIVKSVGTPIVSSCFVNTMVSVFEIDSMIGEIRDKMVNSLLSENALAKMGVSVESITINEIYVNEEDLEMIRNRINN